ncbi:hypothetical protein SFRURICE_002830 [Spodoptera frugiperda]|nr:hypothetical protein SFRURICE_002830 [Spodoptera frugiperda]
MIDDCDDYGDVFLCKNNLCFIFSYKSYSSTKYKRLKNNYIFIITFCADHDQCCGGCCFDGECIDTYRSCYASLDVCDDHICLGEEECIVYIPPECPGCEPLPICRLPNV